MAGRPRECDRTDALVTARGAIWTHGFEGTSMTDLAGALGFATARIDAAFGSKEDRSREAVARPGFARRATMRGRWLVASEIGDAAIDGPWRGE